MNYARVRCPNNYIIVLLRQRTLVLTRLGAGPALAANMLTSMVAGIPPMLETMVANTPSTYGHAHGHGFKLDHHARQHGRQHAPDG